MSQNRTKSSFIHRRTAPGAVPGTLVADPQSPRPKIELIQYGPQSFKIHKDIDLETLKKHQHRMPVNWINIEGLGDIETVRSLGEMFKLHKLALEDVLNVHQRPKLETYKDVLFVVARMPHPELIGNTEQVAFFLGPDFLLTFQEGTPGDSFEPIRRRLRESQGRLRSSSAAYLMYALLDALVDQYFPHLEYYADLLENIEDRIIALPHAPVNSELYMIRRHMLMIRRSIRPLQDVLISLTRENNGHFDEEGQWYLRDCYDHTIQLMDMLETYKDLATHLMEMSAVAVSNRMNEIMRFLTVMSSIFIPLTFISGLYGMNFKAELSPYNMPELSWYYGYPFVLILMGGTVVGLLAFFRYKGWLGIPESERHYQQYVASLNRDPVPNNAPKT